MANPGLDESERLRRRIWYHNVRARSGMSDYILSCKFDLDREAQSVRKRGKVRRRIFERLRKFDEMPFRGRRREFIDLVDGYANCPALRGTSRLYLTPFWDLVGKHPISLIKLREIILESVRASGLLLEPGNYSSHEALLATIRDMTPEEAVKYLASVEDYYMEAFVPAFENLQNNLDTLALIGGIFRETYLAGNLRLALVLEGLFANALQDVSESEWMPKELANEFFRLAGSRILKAGVLKRDDKCLSYLEMLRADENPGSPVAMFLARHDSELW